MTKSHCSAMSFDVIMLRIMRVTSLGTCEYPSASDVTSTYVPYGASPPNPYAYYRSSGNAWGTMGDIAQGDRSVVSYTTRCVGDRPETDQHCTNKLTYDECVNHTVGPASVKHCVWQG